MAGHSKWANRKHRKERQDAKKGQVFSKMAREIAVAARLGGPNPEANPRLRLAIEKARELRVPWENIERAINRGAGKSGEDQYEEAFYEGYGPGGVAVLVSVLTSNRKKTAGEIRHLFSRFGGSLGEAGCVSWLFDRKGLLVLDRSAAPSEEEVIMDALEAGAEDVRGDDESLEIVTSPDDFEAVKKALQEKGYVFLRSDLTMLPRTETPVSGADAERLFKLLEALDDHDDVQEVFSNFSVDDAELLRLGA